MDELDQLLTAKQDVVYNFFNWPTMRDSQLFVVAVANRMDLPQQLAAKVKSRLGMWLPRVGLTTRFADSPFSPLRQGEFDRDCQVTLDPASQRP